MVPDEVLHRMEIIQQQTGKPIPVQVREALDRYVWSHIIAGEIDVVTSD